MNRSAVLAPLLLAGCHEVFGIDPPAARPPGPPDGPCTDPHDEDQDLVPDCSDNCPGLFNDDQANVLEAMSGRTPDSVGDACDPNPGASGDRLVRFITFGEPNAMDRWNPFNSWSLENEDLVVEASGSEVAIVDSVPPPAPPYVIQFDFTLQSAATEYSFFEIITDSTQIDPPKNVYCGISRYNSGGDDYVIVGSDHDSPVVIDNDARYGGTFVAGRHRADLLYEPGSKLACGIRPMNRGRVVAEAALPGTPPAGDLGFMAFRMAVRIHFVAIYQRDP